MVQFSIRLPDDMYGHILETAQAEHRSLNAQVLTMLEETLDKNDRREKDQG